MPTDIEIARKIDKLVDSYGLGVVVIDGIDNVFSADKSTRRNVETASIANSLKTIARKYGIPIIVTISTPSKVDQREDKRPKISDLDDWETLVTETSNIIILLYQRKCIIPIWKTTEAL